MILASDHGHVWHRPECRALERRSWKPLASPDRRCSRRRNCRSTGSRVREENGSNTVIVPWAETIYYSKATKRLSRRSHAARDGQPAGDPDGLSEKTSTYPGLFACEYPKPEWWSGPTCCYVRSVEQNRARRSPLVLTQWPNGLFDDLLEEEQIRPQRRSEAVPQARTVSGVDRRVCSPRQATKIRRSLFAAMPLKTISCGGVWRHWMPAAAS